MFWNGGNEKNSSTIEFRRVIMVFVMSFRLSEAQREEGMESVLQQTSRSLWDSSGSLLVFVV
jgi:hypothetical protein